MRLPPPLVVALLLGCSAPPGGDKPPPGAPRTAGLDEAPPANPATDADLGTRAVGSDWPCFLGPQGNNTSTETGIMAHWPKEGLRLVWQCPLGEGYGAPVVAKGRLFHFERVKDNARLTCRRSETGELLWRFEYPTDYEDFYNYSNGPRASPVVDGDRVYVHGVEGMLHCLRATDGKPLWKVDTKAEFGFVQNFFGVGSCPVVEGDLLIVPVGGSPPGSNPSAMRRLKGNGSGLVAFNKLTGRVVWKASDELASYATPILATVNGRRWGFHFARGGLVGFDPVKGTVDFEFPWRARILESVNASSPVVAGDRVLITECYGPGAALLKVRPGGCDVVWTDEDRGRAATGEKSLQCHWNTPIHFDGYVYGSSGRHTEDAELRCVELATGKVMWREPRFTRTSLLGVDGHFLCLGEDGTLRLLNINPKRYEEVSRLELDGLNYPCWAAPILSHGLLYVRGRDRLLCLELIPVKKP
jgi:outer membrane protein assembly factor BamB